MPWIVPKTKLDTDQRAVLDTLLIQPRSQWIRGFAGSGKSVLLIHALREKLIEDPNTKACVIAFTHALKDMLKTGLSQNSRHVPVMTYHEFKSNPFYCDYIFVDEVQDLEPYILDLLDRHSDHLIMAGDEEQSIYDNRVDPDDIEQQTNPVIHSLTIVYRLTEKLKQIVASILPEARLQAARNARLTADVNITLAKARDSSQELEWVWKEAQRSTRTGDPVAILVAKHRLVKEFIESACRESGIASPRFTYVRGKPNYEPVNQYLEANGLPLRYLGNSYGSLDDGDHQRIIYIMTYHSSKGLDFETVFLPGVNSGLSIWKNDDDKERRVFYVAATRSRRNLFISYSGAMPHRLVQGMPQELIQNFDITAVANQSSADNFDDLF